jgi:hypothetical protein
MTPQYVDSRNGREDHYRTSEMQCADLTLFNYIVCPITVCLDQDILVIPKRILAIPPFSI